MIGAVIDLGTNTFHLMIAKSSGDSYEVIDRKRVFVHLGRDGLHYFNDEAINAAFKALINFHIILQDYPSYDLRIIGTSAMRTSRNAHVIRSQVLEVFGIDTEIISGKEEARLILQGIRQDTLPRAKSLIMDIGGGSVEFILFDQEEVYYCDSFQIGIGYLFQKFEINDPATKEDMLHVRKYIEQELLELSKEIRQHDIKYLIGASGTFDLIFNEFKAHSNGICLSEKLLPIISQFIYSSTRERESNPTILDNRVRYIPMAFQLLVTVLELEKSPKQIIYSQYSLKEGVLWEMFS